MNRLSYTLSVLLVLVSSITYAQDKDEPLIQESDTLALYGENFTGLSQLDSVVTDYKVFVSGENHTYTESNARIWLKMIKYLHKTAGVRNVIFEYGYSYGWLVNEYLKTGDTTLYNSIKNFAYIEYSRAIKELYDFNQTLDSNERIYLCAIDIERGIYPIAKLLDYLLPESYEAHDSITVHLQSLESLTAYNEQKLKEQKEDSYVTFAYKSSPTLQLLQDNFLRFEEEYRKVLGDNFDHFKAVITDRFNARNLWYEYDKEAAVQQYVFRENYMHQNFLKEAATHGGGWFGQFGRCHTTKSTVNSNACDWYTFSSLANRIENTKGGAYKDALLTLGIVYENDRNMGVANDEFESMFDKYFVDMPRSSVALLRVAKDSSLDSAYGHDFDFMLLNTNSKKGEAYEEAYDYYSDEDDDIGTSVKFGISTVRRDVGLSNLNTLFSDAGVGGKFASPLTGIGISLMIGSKDEGKVKFYSGTEIGGYLTDSVTSSVDNVSYKLAGFYYRSQYLYNITGGLDFIDIMPGIEFGYERLKLTSTTTNRVTNDVLDGYLGNEKRAVYFNPALTLGAVIALDLNIKHFYLGYLGGYSFDASKKQWRTGGEIVADSPSTSFTGLTQSIRVGLVF